MSACRLPAGAYVLRLLLCKVAALMLMAGMAMAEPLRLVAIGDSLTHGYGLPPEDGFVPQLERWLQAQGREVVVINMGVSGDTTEGGRARLGWALGDGADAVIVELGGNDLLRGIDPARSRANLDAMLTELAGMGIPTLITGLEAPLNYGPDYKEAFDSMFGDLAEVHGAVHYPNFLEGIEPGMMQPDGIHPASSGVAAIVEGIGPKVLELLDRVGQ